MHIDGPYLCLRGYALNYKVEYEGYSLGGYVNKPSFENNYVGSVYVYGVLYTSHFIWRNANILKTTIFKAVIYLLYNYFAMDMCPVVAALL